MLKSPSRQITKSPNHEIQNLTPSVKFVVQPPRSILVPRNPAAAGMVPSAFCQRTSPPIVQLDTGARSPATTVGPTAVPFAVNRAGKIELSSASTNSPTSL